MQHGETITKKENCNKRYEIDIIRKDCINDHLQ